MGWFLIDLGGACADALGGRCGVVVGRDPAGGGQGAARRSRQARRATLGLGVVGADRGAVGAGAGGGCPVRAVWAAVDRDGELRAVDGDQAPLRVGVRDVDAGGLRLDPPAAVLPVWALTAAAGRVHGPQAHAPIAGRGGARAHAAGDCEGQAGEAVSAAGGADRRDRGRSRYQVSDRRRAGRRRGQGAGAGGTASSQRRSMRSAPR